MDEVTIAVQEALEKQVPHPNAVRQVLQKRSEERMEPSPIAIPLPDDKRVKDLNVKTHALIGYDQINATADDTTDSNKDQQPQQAQSIQSSTDQRGEKQ
ncbi:hypothetical protein [Bathymodiolus platifrons methanotrophic gill symbiont]|uniref:hypothetical protein n=1 Tax=Bathymodiolus platifrons methanotrophic gill symbiont TaxID=113268 RepID=UPI001C8DD1C5|nr:hypothetical protein [Bathymodiolus platifrons methanotrophic gill symbiont]